MIKVLATLAATGLLCMGPVTENAAADTLTFDGLTNAGSMNTSHYGGLNWSGFNALVSDSFHTNDATGNMFAYSNWSGMGSDTGSFPFTVSFFADEGKAFDFIQADFSANWENNLKVTVSASLDGAIKSSQELSLLDGTFKTFAFNYLGVDQVTFSIYSQNYSVYTAGYGGTGNPFYWQQQYAFSMDNVVVHPTPEPATMLLFGTGLSALAGAVRRRLKK